MSRKQGLSVNQTSTFTEDLFTANPFFDKVMALSDPRVQEVIEAISKFGAEGNFEDEDAALEAVLANFDGDLEMLLDMFEDTADNQPSMPSAPKPAEVYARVSSESVVIDVGSGDGRKASKCQANIVMTDIVGLDASTNRPYRVNECKAENISEIVVKYGDAEDIVLTSYNSLSQVSDLTGVKQYDGIHLLPDVAYLVDTMCSESCGDKVFRTVVGGKVFVDHLHDLPSVEVSQGFIGVNFFREAKITLKEPIGRGILQPFNIPCKDTDVLLNVPSTPKYDGIAMKLTVQGEHAGLSTRNGNTVYFSCTATDRTPRICAFVEKLPAVGKPRFYVLLRILDYRGMVPFHGLPGLEFFCKRVKLKIFGVPVVPPGDPRLIDEAFDGLIFRMDGKDYRYKDIPTFDARNVKNKLDRLAAINGYRMTLNVSEEILQDKTNLHEYSITPGDGGTIVRHVRKREDKTTETCLDSIVDMLERFVWQ